MQEGSIDYSHPPLPGPLENVEGVIAQHPKPYVVTNGQIVRIDPVTQERKVYNLKIGGEIQKGPEAQDFLERMAHILNTNILNPGENWEKLHLDFKEKSVTYVTYNAEMEQVESKKIKYKNASEVKELSESVKKVIGKVEAERRKVISSPQSEQQAASQAEAVEPAPQEANQTAIIKTAPAEVAEPKAHPQGGQTALFTAVESGNLDDVKLLLKSGADPNVIERSGHTAFVMAALMGNADVVKLFLESGTNPNVSDESGRTVLMSAAAGSDPEMVKLLLQYGADPHVVNTDGQTALMYAAENLEGDKAEVVKILLQSGADPNVVDKNGFTALMLAATNGKSEAVDLFLKANVDLNVVNTTGATALMLASMSDTAKVAERLLTSGADPNVIDTFGYTALMYAAKCGKTEMVDLLLKSNVDPDVIGKDGFTALLLAAARGRAGRAEAVDLLLTSGADPYVVNKDGDTVLSLLKSIRPANWEAMSQSIKENASVESKKQAQQFKRTKLVTHAFAIGGSGVIAGKEIPFEGSSGGNIAAATMARSCLEFAKESPTLLHADSANQLSEILQFAADQNSHTPLQILERIKNGEPTCILTGSDNHAATVLIWENLFILCDRGGLAQTPLSIHSFDPSKLDEDSIKLLLFKNRSLEEFQNMISITLPETLAFEQTENERALEDAGHLPFQIVGNCSWASKEGIVKAFLLLKELESPGFAELTDDTEKMQRLQSVDTTFTSWQLFQQMRLLEKYLKGPVDSNLVLQSFNALWNTKECCPHAFDEQLIKRLESLEATYEASISGTHLTQFRISKVRCTALPSSDPLEQIEAVTSAMSLIYDSSLNST